MSTQEDFVERSIRDGNAANQQFVVQRFFTADDELIRSDGKTYSVSNQWGPRAMEWMNQVIAAFPGQDVAVEEVKGSLDHRDVS